MYYCKYCGTRLENGSGICAGCGAKIDLLDGGQSFFTEMELNAWKVPDYAFDVNTAVPRTEYGEEDRRTQKPKAAGRKAPEALPAEATAEHPGRGEDRGGGAALPAERSAAAPRSASRRKDREKPEAGINAAPKSRDTRPEARSAKGKPRGYRERRERGLFPLSSSNRFIISTAIIVICIILVVFVFLGKRQAEHDLQNSPREIREDMIGQNAPEQAYGGEAEPVPPEGRAPEETAPREGETDAASPQGGEADAVPGGNAAPPQSGETDAGMPELREPAQTT